MQSKSPNEPIAPVEAVVNKEGKDFMAGEYFPWAHDNASFRKKTNEYCANK